MATSVLAFLLDTEAGIFFFFFFFFFFFWCGRVVGVGGDVPGWVKGPLVFATNHGALSFVAPPKSAGVGGWGGVGGRAWAWVWGVARFSATAWHL